MVSTCSKTDRQLADPFAFPIAFFEFILRLTQSSPEFSSSSMTRFHRSYWFCVEVFLFSFSFLLFMLTCGSSSSARSFCVVSFYVVDEQRRARKYALYPAVSSLVCNPSRCVREDLSFQINTAFDKLFELFISSYFIVIISRGGFSSTQPIRPIFIVVTSHRWFQPTLRCSSCWPLCLKPLLVVSFRLLSIRSDWRPRGSSSKFTLSLSEGITFLLLASLNLSQTAVDDGEFIEIYSIVLLVPPPVVN